MVKKVMKEMNKKRKGISIDKRKKKKKSLTEDHFNENQSFNKISSNKKHNFKHNSKTSLKLKKQKFKRNF
ncbi:MAG: hypothetical protein GY823_05805 [Flavobacteriaceae bacterium]|nr:hypothetical protein [Flavobacteriaceae bacterium]